MSFAAPWFLLLLLTLPAMFWWRRRRLGPGSLRFSSTSDASRTGRSLRQRVGFFPDALRLLGLALLIIALARPQEGMEQVREVSEGIAIQMVVDRSSSMGEPMIREGIRTNRLDVVKDLFEAFVLGDGDDLEGRSTDLVGLIAFAGFAETVCPLTLAHGALPRFLETVRLAQPRSAEDGTAIGDAIALAAARLETAEDALAEQAPDRADKYTIQSKVMILLTDGRQTAGERNPVDAAKLAAEWGIRIYTIAVGGQSGARAGDSIFGRLFQMRRGAEVDTETLKAIASETGGRFYLAEDAGSLARIYEEIDALERTKIEALRFMDYRERFVPFALVGLLALVAEAALASTWLRKVP